MTLAPQEDVQCAPVLGRPGLKAFLSVGAALVACLGVHQPVIDQSGKVDHMMYQTCAPVIAVLFIGFTINRQNHYTSWYKHWTYRCLILTNVSLLLVALIDALRVL